jgi:hypothetical protein
LLMYNNISAKFYLLMYNNISAKFYLLMYNNISANSKHRSKATAADQPPNQLNKERQITTRYYYTLANNEDNNKVANNITN